MKRRIACGVAIAFTPRAQCQQTLPQSNEDRQAQDVAQLLERANFAQLCQDPSQAGADFDESRCSELENERTGKLEESTI